MLRRSKSDSAEATVDEATSGDPTADQAGPKGQTAGKGRPTPTRKEAEAAAKARAKVPRTKKEQQAAQRLARSESSAKLREGMKTGEERYLLPRDKGPVKRFVRDYVDSRFTVLEVAIPIMIVFLIPSFVTSSRAAVSVSEAALLIVLAVMIVNALVLRRAIRAEVRERFPDEPTKGLTYYLVSRASQMRFMRMPKPQVKRGDKLREHYH